MKLNRIKFIERFILITFPVALAVGCTTTTDHQSKAAVDTTLSQSSESSKTATVDARKPGDAMNTLTSTNAADHINVRSAGTTDTVYKDNLLEVKVRLSGEEKMQMPAKTIFQFAVNKYDLNGADLEILKQHAHYLKSHTDLTLYVDGFSDNRGSSLVNYKLSKKRAQQVADLLKSYGAPQTQIKVNGYGESFPLNNEKNWDENRRVELEYVESSIPGELYASYK